MHPRFDTEARLAVAQATDLARELGHAEVGPDHLLLGLLANTRGAAYAALTDHGLTFAAARALVADQHQDPVDQAETSDDTDAHAAPTAYVEDREALRAIGIDLDRVRQSVKDNLGQDLADGWATRTDRGRRGDRRGRPRHHHHVTGHDGRGRRGPRSRRSAGPRFSRELRGLLRDVRRPVGRDPLDGDRTTWHEGRGMSGTRLLAALIRSDDRVVQAVLAGATDLDGLRAHADAADGGTAV
jgi:hypothetical protein